MRANSTQDVPFSSPFISISFKALIEKPSERGIGTEYDLRHIEEMTRNSMSVKRFARDSGEIDGSTVIPESPPRKRPVVQRIEESPVAERHTNSFLDRFRNTVKYSSSFPC